jgi:hypothetical protein
MRPVRKQEMRFGGTVVKQILPFLTGTVIHNVHVCREKLRSPLPPFSGNGRIVARAPQPKQARV